MKETQELTPDDLIIQKNIASRFHVRKKKKIIACIYCGTLSINNSHTCYSKWNPYYKYDN